jgi:DNA-binding NtrC family response regulator
MAREPRLDYLALLRRAPIEDPMLQALSGEIPQPLRALDEPDELAPRGPLVVLAVEPSPVRDALRMAIEKEGCELVELPGASGVVEWLARAPGRGFPPPQLVIGDVRSGESGTLIGAVRAIDPGVMVMLVCAAGDGRLPAELRRRGAFAVTEQPVDLDSLTTAIRSAVWW